MSDRRAEVATCGRRTARIPRAQRVTDGSSRCARRAAGRAPTFNNPIGDIAEEPVAAHFGGERGSFSQAVWDVRTPNGELLQVKAVRRTGKRTRHNRSRSARTPMPRSWSSSSARIFGSSRRSNPAGRRERTLSDRPDVNGRVITLTAKLLARPKVTTFELSDALLDAKVPDLRLARAARDSMRPVPAPYRCTDLQRPALILVRRMSAE